MKIRYKNLKTGKGAEGCIKNVSENISFIDI